MLLTGEEAEPLDRPSAFILRRPLPPRVSWCFVSFGPSCLVETTAPWQAACTGEIQIPTFRQKQINNWTHPSKSCVWGRLRRAEERRTISTGYTHPGAKPKTGSSDTWRLNWPFQREAGYQRADVSGTGSYMCTIDSLTSSGCTHRQTETLCTSTDPTTYRAFHIWSNQYTQQIVICMGLSWGINY